MALKEMVLVNAKAFTTAGSVVTVDALSEKVTSVLWYPLQLAISTWPQNVQDDWKWLLGWTVTVGLAAVAAKVVQKVPNKVGNDE